MTPARPVSNPRPEYPPSAIRLRQEGVVMLRLTIGSDGRVNHLEMDASSGHSELDRSAMTAVSRWQFEPARQKGQPIEWTVKLPVRFRLP